MNPTARKRLSWMILIVAVALIWNLSSQIRTRDTMVSFSDFIRWVNTGQVDRVELTGNEIVGTSSSGESFRTHAPPQYEGLVNTLIERDVVVQSKEAASPWLWAIAAVVALMLAAGLGGLVSWTRAKTAR